MRGAKKPSTMQALSATEDSMKPSGTATLTWKEPVEIGTQLRTSNGVSGAPMPGPAGDPLGLNRRTASTFIPQQQLGRIHHHPHSIKPENGHHEYGQSFADPSRHNGIPENVMVMPLADSNLASASPPSARKTIRSRARPRRPEEPAPFLSVDTLPADKVVLEVKTNSSKNFTKRQNKSVSKRMGPEVLPPSTARRSQTPSNQPFSPYGGGRNTPRASSRAGSSTNYNSFFTHKNSAFLAGPPSLWSLGNRFWPHQATPAEGRRRLAPLHPHMAIEPPTDLKPNVHVSHPFKHNIDNATPLERPISPGQDMKESTLMALHDVTRVLARQQDPPPSRKGGRLLKGKLKPLHTFQLDGPPIQDCNGILSEDSGEGGTTANKALLLQRKQELLSMLPPDVFHGSRAASDPGQTRPGTQDSIHRTSIVSAISLDRDTNLLSPRMHTTPNGKMKSQTVVEAHAPIGPVTSMVSIADESVVHQVDIPAEEVGGRDERPEQGDDERFQTPDEVLGGRDGGAMLEVEPLFTKGDGEKASDAVSESSMSDYLSEGGRAEILCNMVSRVKEQNSQASANDPKMDDYHKPEDDQSDATEIEPGFDDVCPLNASHQSQVPDVAVVSENVANDGRINTGTQLEEIPARDSVDSREIPESDTADSNKLADPPASSENNNNEDPETVTEQTDVNANKLEGGDAKQIIEQSGNPMQESSKTPPEIFKDEHMEQSAGRVTESQENQSASIAQAILDTQDTVIEKSDSDIQVVVSNEIVSVSIADERTLESVEKDSEDIVTSDRAENVMSSEHQQTLAQNSESIPAVSISISVEDDSPAMEIENNGVAEQRQTNEITETVEDTLPETESISRVEITTDSAIKVSTDTQAISEMTVPAVEISVVMEDQSNAESTNDRDDVNENVPSQSEPTEECTCYDDANKIEDTVTNAPEETTVQETISNNSNVERTSSSDVPVSISITVDTPIDANHETELDRDSSGNTVIINVEEPKSSAIHQDDADNEAKTGGDGEKEDKKEEEETDADGNDGQSDKKGKDKDDSDSGGDGGGNSGQSGGGGAGSGGGGDSNGSSERGGSQSGGGGGEGGGEGGGDGRDNSKKDRDAETDCGEEEEKAKADEEIDEGLCFKSLEQLLAEVRAQSSREQKFESYDDIPEVYDSVLYCGVCGLDEDECVCPNSSLHRLITQDNLQNRPELEDELSSSQQENLVLEYRKLLGEQEQPTVSCYSDDLVSPRRDSIEAWNEHEGTRQTHIDSSPAPSHDYMLASGVSITPAQRPSSVKRRPGSSRPSRPSSHYRKSNHPTSKMDEDLATADIASDSGCGSELSEALTHASELHTDDEDDLSASKDVHNQCQETTLQHTERTLESRTIEPGAKSASLEVVAKTKPRHAKQKTEEVPLAPFPPLCFKINARPPPGKLYYFAYGPTMNPTRLSTYIGSQVDQRLWGILFGFALRFNKKGEDIEAGGFANVEFSPDSSVEGCVYCLTPPQLDSLDKFLGCPQFYIKTMLPVWMVNCSDPNEVGVAQYCIPAVVYIAQDKWTHKDSSQPLTNSYSIRQCMTGSDMLSPAYKQHLQALVC